MHGGSHLGRAPRHGTVRTCEMQPGWCPAYVLASLFLAEKLGATAAEGSGGGKEPCSRLFRAAVERNGSVSSPHYPAPYPSGVECSFTFMASGSARVRLVFKDFDLYQFRDNDPNDCTGDDAVIPAIEIDGEQTNIHTYCGQKRPPGLMSSGPHMTLTFKSMTKPRHSKVTNRGFLAHFQFVDNFGIDAEKSASHPCGFVYNSSRRVQGTFTSPNYPGLYPRNIECHYFFYGRGHERVRLTFAYFDVEGIYPCQADGQRLRGVLKLPNHRPEDASVLRAGPEPQRGRVGRWLLSRHFQIKSSVRRHRIRSALPVFQRDRGL